MEPQELTAKIDNLIEQVKNLREEITDAEDIAEIFPYAHFPKMWDFGDEPGDGHGGPVPVDPGTICVVFAENKAPFSFSLSYLVDDLLESCASGLSEKYIGDEHAPAARSIMEALRTAADKIEHAIQQEE